jgi:uncharacterized radical SAM superfamily Fe-S cluster-containing enzyme
MEVVVKMLKALLDRPVPCRSVQFSGGEPTLHPDFPRILSAARDLGFTHLQVATNGSRFVDPDYAKLCEESGLHTLYLQFDGMNDEVYLKMRGQRLLDKKIAAVRSIEQTNMRLVLVPTIMSSVNATSWDRSFSSPWNTTSLSPASAFSRPRMWAASR